LAEYHPDRETLECFARGECIAETEQWILDHLRSGCAICQRTVDDLLPSPETLASSTASLQLRQPLARVPSRTREGAVSPGSPVSPVSQAPPPHPDSYRLAALACPAGAEDVRRGTAGGSCLPDPAGSLSLPLSGCRDDARSRDRAAAGAAAMRRDGPPGRPGRPEAADVESEAWDRIFAKLEQRLTLIASERTAAPQLLDELLRRPVAERGAVVHVGRRFQSLALCDLLLDESCDAGSHDSSDAIALAELGILVADHLDTRYYGSAVVHDMRSRAWAYLGNARRLASDFAGAEQALRFAEALAEDGSADPLEEARLLDLKALLLGDQGWFEEAAEMLDTVVEIYEDVKDLHRKGRTLISKGVYLGCSGRPQQAVELIAQGLALLDGELEPRLALAARQELAWFLNECGWCERAQGELDSCRRSPEAGGDARTELRLEWLDARIAQRSGRWQEAEHRLGGLLQRFVAAGLGYEAALVLLDVVTLDLELERRGEICRLAEEQLPAVLALDIHRQAAAALVTFQQAAACDRVTPALVRDIAAYLRRACKNPRLSFQLPA
jgi:tetratricopeptide (TPR) repeat protein